MKIQLHDGTNIERPVEAQITGLRIGSITLGSRDIQHLRSLKGYQLYEWVKELSTRFVPADSATQKDPP